MTERIYFIADFDDIPSVGEEEEEDDWNLIK